MIAETQNPPADSRLDDLAQIISAYNQVTQKLQTSHEALEAEVARLRRELRSTNAQLQRSKRLSALGEMAAGIAHEIRNPLAAIQLYAGMALEDLAAPGSQAPAPGSQTPTPGSTNAYPISGVGPASGSDPIASAADSTRKIAAAVQGLSAIVNDVLAFARHAEPAPRTLLAVDVIGRAVDAHLPAIDAAGVTIARRDLQRPELELHADPNLLHQALLNLIRNAVDAMADHNGDRTLTIDARQGRFSTWEQGGHASTVDTPRDDRADAAVIISVRDTGPGISEDDIDRIFNPFFTTRNTGTGLGLAIVHRILDAHGGAIRAFNQTSGATGACFELILPQTPTPSTPPPSGGGTSSTHANASEDAHA